MKPIDLRSDTVTQPTTAMREAMAAAAVGDDVYAEDPTVNRLQDLVAEMSGFEAGLLMPTGTMSNLAAMLTHAGRGTEVIVPAGAHVYDYELGGMAVVGGLVPREVLAPRGVPAVADMRGAIRRSVHVAPPGLIVLENTHNQAGGTVVPLEHCHAVADLAAEEGLPLHLDGARGFNAAVALGASLAELCTPFDSASLCLSKGLAAPVGTVLVGSRAFIDRAHRYRKILGGGMRQAGVIAAAGIVAIEQMFARLSEDHARARRLAESLQELGGVRIDLDSVQTNMVYLEVPDAPGLVAALRSEGVLAGAMGPTRLRLVTHYQIHDEDVAETVAAFARVLDRQTVA
jgi:threonine aldolase